MPRDRETAGAEGAKGQSNGQANGQASGRPQGNGHAAMHNGHAKVRSELWSAIKPGDRVEAFSGEPIGEVIEVSAEAVTVHDPVENRDLLIPRDVCEARPGGGGIRLQEHPVHSAGTGPERFVRRSNLADDWVAEQTADPSRMVMVEADSPLQGRRVTDDGMAMVPDEADLAETMEDERPSEVRTVSLRDGALASEVNRPPPPVSGLHARTAPSTARTTTRSTSRTTARKGSPMKKTVKQAAAMAKWSPEKTQALLSQAVHVAARMLGMRRIEVWVLGKLMGWAHKLDAHLTRGYHAKRSHMS